MSEQKRLDLEGVLDDFLVKYRRIVTGRLAFNTVADLEADDTLTAELSIGEQVHILERGGFDLVKLAAGAANYHYQTTAGDRFLLRMDSVTPMMLGAEGDGATDDTVALDLVLGTDAVMIDLGGRSFLYTGSFVPDRPIRFGTITDDNGAQDYTPVLPASIASAASVMAGSPVDQLVTIEGLLARLQPNIAQTVFKSTTLYAANFSHQLSELDTQIITRWANCRVRVSMSLSFDHSAISLIKVFRNGVEIMVNTDPAGSRLVGAFGEYHSTSQRQLHTTSFAFLDDGITSAGLYTYTFEIHANASAALGLNRSIIDVDGDAYRYGVSVVMLEEIAPAAP